MFVCNISKKNFFSIIFPLTSDYSCAYEEEYTLIVLLLKYNLFLVI